MNSLAPKILLLNFLIPGSLVLGLGGCTQPLASQSGGNWHENDYVTRNLAAQLSNPMDLTRGHGDLTVPAQPLVTAITSWSAHQSSNSGGVASPTLSGMSGSTGAS
jgi:hypothetical protein